MPTGLVDDPRFLDHVAPYGHPEHPGRLKAIRARFEADGLASRCVCVPAREAADEEILRIHTAAHVRFVDATASSEFRALDPDTYTSRGSAEAARLAAGGLVDLASEVLSGRLANGFALLRPPGHHAEADRAMGFCLYNNVAVAARAVQAAGSCERVLIVDWDVHHGNGTEHAFYDDPSVLAISLHQDGLYPAESGLVEQTGEGDGEGYTINVPLPPGSGNGAYVAALEQVVVPAVSNFDPDIVVIASGLDASMMDPLAMMCVTSEGYRQMTDVMVDLAATVCEGKLVAVHEGGYSTSYVPFCGAAVIEGLLGSEESIEDPYIEAFRGMGYTDVQPHQQEVIEAAAQHAAALA